MSNAIPSVTLYLALKNIKDTYQRWYKSVK